MKSAISLDGRIAAKDGSSQWISSETARLDAHQLRAESQAIVVGSGTAIKDTPQLTVRLNDIALKKPPIRVIVDSQGSTPCEGPLFDINLAPTLILTTEQTSTKIRNNWEKKGVESIVVPQSKEKVNLKNAWKILAEKGILQVLVEGGAKLQTSLFNTSLVNQLTIYKGPLLLGKTGLPMYLNEIESLDVAPRLFVTDVKRFEDTIRLDYSLKV